MLYGKTLKNNIFAVFVISIISTLLQYFFNRDTYVLQVFAGTFIGMLGVIAIFFYADKKREKLENKKDVK